jgi:putative redox protein
MTLKMYAERKAWPLVSARVALTIAIVRDNDGEALRINRVLTLDGDLNSEQRTRMADIAERTPVTLLIKNGAQVHTALARP